MGTGIGDIVLLVLIFIVFGWLWWEVRQIVKSSRGVTAPPLEDAMKQESCSKCQCIFCERLQHLVQTRYVLRVKSPMELKWTYDEIINRLLDMLEAEECDYIQPCE